MRLFHAAGLFPAWVPGIACDFSMRAGLFPAWIPGIAHRGCSALLRYRYHAHGPPYPCPLKQVFCVSASCSRLELTRWASPGDDRIAVGPTDGPDGRPGTTDGPDGWAGRTGQTDRTDNIWADRMGRSDRTEGQAQKIGA